MAEVQEVTAEVLDPPAVQTELDRAVSEAETKAATIRERYMPHEIRDAEDYRQSKRDRAALRREWKSVEDSRKALLGQAKQWIRDRELRFAPAVDAYKQLDAEVKSNLDEFERQADQSKMAEVAEFYQDLAPDLVPLVPLSKLDEVYGKAKKWHNATTNVQQVKADVEAAVNEIADAERTIEGMGYDAQDGQAFKAYYFQSLDFGDAARRAQADREQRQRVEALEAERAERAKAQREAAGSAQDAASGNQSGIDANGPQRAPEPPTGASVAQEVADTAAQPWPGDEVPPIAFMAYVTEAQRAGLVAYCRRNGIHGSFRATHGRRMRLAEREDR